MSVEVSRQHRRCRRCAVESTEWRSPGATHRQLRSALEAQLILDRYRPLAELGEGGYGTVTLAWDTRMQRRVAIKRLPLPLDDRGRPHQPPGLAEARTAAMLNHPAIVTVFDFDTDSDEAFLVMEYVDGASLGDLLDDIEGPLTLDETAAVVDAVGQALEFAHDNGVLHLDIKPDNVLVARDGRVKVADFGISELSSLSGHGSAFGGTLGYMPLEQLRGEEVTENTDQWALAALTYELLTRVNPFDDDTLEEAVLRLETDQTPLPSSYEPDVPRQLDEILVAALGNEPSDRYDSVAEFADAALMFLGSPGVGRASLAELVDTFVDEEAAEEPGFDRVGVWDRLQGRLGTSMLRAVAAAEAGWLAWSGLTPFSLETPALLAAVGLVAVAAVLAPSLGMGLGLGCLIAGVFASGAWAVGAGLLLVGVAWWWFLARRSPGAAVLPLSAPLLSVTRAGLAQPLLAGFSLRPLPAAVTALLGGVLAALASAVSAKGAPYLAVWAPYVADIWRAELAAASIRALVTSPAAYVALAGWPLAAVVMSLMCGRATRVSAMVGAVAGIAVLGGAYVLAGRVAHVTGAAGQWAGNSLAVALVASLILIMLVAALGAPIRAEEDEPPHTRAARDE